MTFKKFSVIIECDVMLVESKNTDLVLVDYVVGLKYYITDMDHCFFSVEFTPKISLLTCMCCHSIFSVCLLLLS